jgi:hypothetical protein
MIYLTVHDAGTLKINGHWVIEGVNCRKVNSSNL